IKNSDSAAAGDRNQVVHGIDCYPLTARLQDSGRRCIAVGVSREYQYLILLGHVNFSVNVVHRDGLRIQYPGARPQNLTNGRDIAIRISAESEDRIGMV